MLDNFDSFSINFKNILIKYLEIIRKFFKKSHKFI